MIDIKTHLNKLGMNGFDCNPLITLMMVQKIMCSVIVKMICIIVIPSAHLGK